VARPPYRDPDQADPRVAELLGKAPALRIFRMVANAQRAFPATQEQLDAIRRGELDAAALGAPAERRAHSYGA
jgi:hypothetical protein